MTGVTAFAIGVQGFRDSLYTIMLTFGDSTTPLSNGVPVTGSVSTGKYVYYSFATTNTTVPITVVLTRIAGDPDLVINNGTNTVVPRPTIGHAAFSELAYGSDWISIPSHSGTNFTIGVYGSGNSEFVITAVQSAVITLSDGVPQADFLVGGTSQSYQLLTNGQASSMSFTLTLTAGTATIAVFAVPGAGECNGDLQHADWRASGDYFTPAQINVAANDPSLLTRCVEINDGAMAVACVGRGRVGSGCNSKCDLGLCQLVLGGCLAGIAWSVSCCALVSGDCGFCM